MEKRDREAKKINGASSNDAKQIIKQDNWKILINNDIIYE